MNTQQSGGKIGRILLFLIIIAVTAVLVWWFLLRDKTDDTTLRLYGNVDIREVALAFRQPGRLTEMLFDEGDQVMAGEMMAQLDAEPYRNQLAIAEAELQAAQAEVDKLHSGNRPQEVLQAEAAVAQSQANYQEAERQYQRQSALVESGATSQRAVDAAVAMRNQTAANLAAAKASLSLVVAGFRDEDIAAGEARLAKAQAAVSQARTALADTDLIAPSDATVLARVREPGSMVASSSPVYSLSLRDPVYVRAYVSEPNLGHIAPGTQVRVFTDSSDQAYQGQIGFISPRAEFTPKSVETTDLRTDLVYRLRITVNDPNQNLRQGMPVTVEVDRNDMQIGNQSSSG